MTQIIANNNGWWGWSSSGYVTWPNWAVDENIVIFNWTTGKTIKDSGVSLSEKQDTLTAWTDLEIIPPAWDQTVTGNNSISLNWAIDDGLISLTAYWDTRQWHYLPEWYTELWAIQNVAGSTKWNSWYAPNQNWDTIEVRFIANTNSLYLIQARKDSTSPIYWIWGSATGDTIIWYVNWYSVTSSISRVAWHVVYIRFSFASWSMTLYVKDESTGEEDTQTGTYTWANISYSYRIWGNNAQTYWNTMWILYVKMTLWGGAVRELIPAKNSSNVIGWYDIATSTFRSSFEWDSPTQLYISPHPLAPEELSCNNWVIKAFYWNKFTTSWRTAWKLINSTTGILEDNDNYYTTAYIFLRKWSYTATWQDTAAWNRQYKCYSYYDDWTPHALIFSQTSPWTSLNTITFTMNYDSKVRFSYRSSMSNITASPTNPIIYTDWNVETIEDEDWNTATTEMLLWLSNSLATKIDTQEILTGTLKKNCWILVLTWDESRSYQSTNYRFVLDLSTIWTDWVTNRWTPMKCTHYFCVDDQRALTDVPNQCIYGTIQKSIYIHDRRYTTKTNFCNFLKAEYDAWNPVIIVYPRNEATSTVTGQTLTTVEWDNTIEITQSGITPLSITWVYHTPEDTVINFTNDTGYQTVSNMVTSLSSPDNDHYPTALAVSTAISSAWWWDVTWPSSSTDWHLAVFDWITGKLIKDWWAVPTVPSVIDNLTSTSTTDALSANQGKVLKGLIDDIMGQGRFLSLWDSSTWLPISFPLDTPYTYLTWDYFMVETVDSTTNYRPSGSSYSGTASSTAETGEVKVWDYYVYDWTVWLLASNHWKEVSFGNLAWQPSDNANLSTALNGKQNNRIDVTVSTAAATAAKVWSTTAGNYTPTKWDFLLVNFVNGCQVASPTLKIDNGTAIAIMTGGSNVSTATLALWNTWNSNVKVLFYYDGTYYKCWSTSNNNTTYSAMSVSEWQTGTATTARTMRADRLKEIIKYHAVSDTAYASSWDWATDIAPSKNAVYDKIESLNLPIVSSTAPATPTEWMIWYDTTNDKLKTYDGSNWNECWSGGDASNTKTFYLADTDDLTNAQAAYDWFLAGKNPIIIYNNIAHILKNKSSTVIEFWSTRISTYDYSSYTQQTIYYVNFTLSSDTVTAITQGITNTWFNFLKPWVDYWTPYTPQYNGSPATKKYVDDHDTVVSGDSGTTYTIKVSNSAPASWTPNTTITFVVD